MVTYHIVPQWLVSFLACALIRKTKWTTVKSYMDHVHGFTSTQDSASCICSLNVKKICHSCVRYLNMLRMEMRPFHLRKLVIEHVHCSFLVVQKLLNIIKTWCKANNAQISKDFKFCWVSGATSTIAWVLLVPTLCLVKNNLVHWVWHLEHNVPCHKFWKKVLESIFRGWSRCATTSIKGQYGRIGMVQVTAWKDCKQVVFVHNHLANDSDNKTTKWYVKGKNSWEEIECPPVARDYSYNMNGVDKDDWDGRDQNSVSMGTNRWYLWIWSGLLTELHIVVT